MKNTVVLVDDNKILLELCVVVLKKQGFNVESFNEVKKAKEFLLAADANSIRAIISDLIMSPTDGLDFLSFVRSIPALGQIDFFLMTGSLAAVFEPYYRPYNIKGIIHKPFNAPDLINALAERDKTFFLKGAA